MNLGPQYVAGLFDGEGWVRIDTFQPKTRDYPRLQVVAGIAMTHRPIIEALTSQFGGATSSYNGYADRNMKNRCVWRWSIASRIAYRFLNEIREHLIVKADQVELAIQMQEHIFEHNGAMRHATVEFKEGIYAHRIHLAEQITSLKKVNYPPVDDDPMIAAV